MKTKIMMMIFILISVYLFSVSEETLTVSTTVPEDYGVEFPGQYLHMDRLYFAIMTSDGYSYLSEHAPLFINYNSSMGKYCINLLYYGNQSTSYDVVIEVDPGLGWVRNDDVDELNVPIVIELAKSDGPQDIRVDDSGERQVALSVPPAGPRRGEKVLDINLSWDGYGQLSPGVYEADLKITMTTI